MSYLLCMPCHGKTLEGDSASEDKADDVERIHPICKQVVKHVEQAAIESRDLLIRQIISKDINLTESLVIRDILKDTYVRKEEMQILENLDLPSETRLAVYHLTFLNNSVREEIVNLAIELEKIIATQKEKK